MIIASFPSSPWQANCYVVAPAEGGPCVVIDPGVDSSATVQSALEQYQWSLAGVLLTHGHIDHIGDAAEIANDHGVPVWLHEADEFMLTQPALGLGAGTEAMLQQMIGRLTLARPKHLIGLRGVSSIRVAGMDFGVRHAPGHSPGSVLFSAPDEDGDLVWCGDVIFAGSIGRSDLPGGSQQILNQSLKDAILTLDQTTRLLPGHGPSTTVRRERRSNPYLQATFLESQF